MVGISVLVGLPYILFKKIADKKFLFTWSTFGLFPLLIILKTPNLIMDSYLLMPAVGLLVLMVKFFQNFKKIPFSVIFKFLVGLFIILNHQESRNWISMYSFTESAFNRHPTCLTALRATVILTFPLFSSREKCRNSAS